jgi:hypothetical protein
LTRIDLGFGEVFETPSAFAPRRSQMILRQSRHIGLIGAVYYPVSPIAQGEVSIFFGNLHSHTALSDGSGTPAEAYAHADAARSVVACECGYSGSSTSTVAESSQYQRQPAESGDGIDAFDGDTAAWRSALDALVSLINLINGPSHTVGTHLPPLFLFNDHGDCLAVRDPYGEES